MISAQSRLGAIRHAKHTVIFSLPNHHHAFVPGIEG